MTTSAKRDRKKVHALNFIEDTKQSSSKEDEEMNLEEGENGSEIIKEEGNVESEEEIAEERNDDFRPLIQKTEVDYRREEF